MSRNRCVLPALAVLLAAQLTTGIGHAQPVNPLYRLVDAAAQRLATAEPVAAVKWLTGGLITDPQRANQVLDSVGDDARAHGIDPLPVRAVFADQIAANEGIQYTRFGQWKFDPAGAPSAAPDLAETRTQIEGFNKTIVEEIARHQVTLDAPQCPTTLTSATDAVVRDRALDPLHRQALTSATRSFCSAT